MDESNLFDWLRGQLTFRVNNMQIFILFYFSRFEAERVHVCM